MSTEVNVANTGRAQDQVAPSALDAFSSSAVVVVRIIYFLEHLLKEAKDPGNVVLKIIACMKTKADDKTMCSLSWKVGYEDNEETTVLKAVYDAVGNTLDWDCLHAIADRIAEEVEAGMQQWNSGSTQSATFVRQKIDRESEADS